MNPPSNRIDSTQSTIRHTGTPASTGRSIQNQSSNPVTPLQEGQVVKGEIKDLRNNEITLALPDNTTITGYLPDHTNLSIGQIATFKVVELSPKGVVLENLSKNNAGMQDLTILKALEEAEIPKNERNISIVRELLRHRMPIHKDSIQQMIRYSLSNRDVSIESLVIMKKYQLPMDKVTATQFENHKNGNHPFVGKIEEFSNSLPNLLGALAENGPERDVAAFGNRLVSILTDDMPKYKMLNLDLSFIPVDDRETLVEHLKLSLPTEHPLLNAEGELVIRDSILDGSMPLSEMREILNYVLTNGVIGEETSVSTDSAVTPERLSDKDTNSPTSLNELSTAETSSNESPLQVPSTLHVLSEHIEEQWMGMRQVQREIASFLPPSDREELLDALTNASLTEEAKERIRSGSVTLPETLDIIKKQLSTENPAGIKELLTSAPFHSILREAIQTNWMLTPAALMQKEKVDGFYPKMLRELSEVTNLIQNNLSGKDSETLMGQGKSMQQSIDFMKTINQLFSYVQLPVHLKDKNIHSDLYVYTKKQEMKKHPNKLRALLRLEMESLGELDIDITLENNVVNSTFFCEDSFSKSLIETNVFLLEESLAEHGFLFHANVESSKKGFDMVKDILEADSPSVGMTRYSFDIRA